MSKACELQLPLNGPPVIDDSLPFRGGSPYHVTVQTNASIGFALIEKAVSVRFRIEKWPDHAIQYLKVNGGYGFAGSWVFVGTLLVVR